VVIRVIVTLDLKKDEDYGVVKLLFKYSFVQK